MLSGINSRAVLAAVLALALCSIALAAHAFPLVALAGESVPGVDSGSPRASAQ